MKLHKHICFRPRADGSKSNPGQEPGWSGFCLTPLCSCALLPLHRSSHAPFRPWRFLGGCGLCPRLVSGTCVEQRARNVNVAVFGAGTSLPSRMSLSFAHYCHIILSLLSASCKYSSAPHIIFCNHEVHRFAYIHRCVFSCEHVV